MTQLNQALRGADRELSVHPHDDSPSLPARPGGWERLVQAGAGECEPWFPAPHCEQLNAEECVFTPVCLQPQSLAMIKAFPIPP